jgi:ribose 1,5-bisphosphokinase PhnN
VTPTLALFGEKWFGDHFSLGPIFALHFQAHGEAYALMIPLPADNSIAKGTWWTDAGVAFHYHF